MLNRGLCCCKTTESRAYYGRIVLTVILISLLVGSCWVQSPAFAGTGKAYVVIGDIEAPWYSTLLRSIFGQVDIRKDLDPVIQAQANKMKELGHEVEFIEIGLTTDIERMIKDPATKAIAWFGHGDPRIHGTVATYDGDIAPGDIGRWAEEQLAEKIGRPESWKTLPESERRKNMELWQNAHFDLEYAYFHTCYSLASNNLPDVLMADNGRFYGYPEKAYLSDNSVLATKIRGKAVTEGGPKEAPESDTFPGEPYYGMQISYSVGGVTVSGRSDAQQSEAGVVLNTHTLSGDLGSGQLLVNGTAIVQGRARKISDEKYPWMRFPGIGSGNITASVNVQVVVYDQTGNYDVKRFDKTIDVPESGIIKQPFSVAVPVPPGARSGTINIYVTSYHEDGERGVKVSGTFTAGADTGAGYRQEEPVEDPGYAGDRQQDQNVYDGYPQNGEISVHMDGFQLLFDVPPVIENDRTLVPIRRIAEAMGATVDWYEGGYIDILKEGRHIYLAIDTPVALVDEKPVDLDVPPRIINDRTLVPLRFVAETFGLNVKWDESTKSIYLNSY